LDSTLKTKKKHIFGKKRCRYAVPARTVQKKALNAIQKVVANNTIRQNYKNLSNLQIQSLEVVETPASCDEQWLRQGHHQTV